MKAVILAGGYGTRISEETHLKPKPMLEIGGKPVLWHIMKTYSAYGINDFIICCGYKGYMIKEYFANYALHSSDVTFDMRSSAMHIHQNSAEAWSVTVVDTGDETATGGRLKRVSRYIGDDDFCFTYGDGVSDVDITALIAFHKSQKTLATITATQPPGRFGVLTMDRQRIAGFNEKPQNGGSWINGGYFVLSPRVLEYIAGDETPWEGEPMEHLSRDNNLAAYIHDGFWQPLDTLRDKTLLNELWASGKAPWKVWK
ncbi:MAG: glucose-1-phosphate cytidylyltransferase [Candidatus Eremiobacter antarcticus]|nr:glucose-1-phosphate cytidylyltransferase [Candidatus Eremiobacteraeota bacterium]MBC5808052.1 glucose-1-phosphate cytidylyltransferase [Candidatus Eremiobacteraeota bacterium]PZR63457.1 MAG: glucose-1-phosphate cytidylyltransferase [Candidatus Eremiobacter sp. RRmetagenome_bin22]